MIKKTFDCRYCGENDFACPSTRNRHELEYCNHPTSPAVKDPPKKNKTVNHNQTTSAAKDDSEESDTDSNNDLSESEPVQPKQKDIERMAEVSKPEQEDASGLQIVLSSASNGNNQGSTISMPKTDPVVIYFVTIDQKFPSNSLPATVPKPVQLKPYVVPITETVGSGMVSNRYVHETMKYCNELVAIAQSVDSSQDVNASISKYLFDSHFDQHQIVMIVDFLSDLMSEHSICHPEDQD
jgi:hypothetical protein